MSVDHLTALSKYVFGGPKFVDNIKLHRTKSSSVVKNVLYPHFKDDSKKVIGDGDYSTLLDEMTGISVTKQLGVCIVYFSKIKCDIVSCYLQTKEIKGGCAPDIVEGLKSVLGDYQLDIKKMRELGSDNASVMTGSENGVAAILRREVPHLVLVRCVCHSVQLAVSAAAKTLPAHLEFLLSETYSWFSKSSIRQQKYKELYKVLAQRGESDGNKDNPLKIVQDAKTRWSSIEPAVKRVLDQWDTSSFTLSSATLRTLVIPHKL